MRRFVFSLTAVQPHRQHKLAGLWSQGQCLQLSAASCVLIFLLGEWTVICFHRPMASVAECRITLMDQNVRDINSRFSPPSAVCFPVPAIPLGRSRASCACCPPSGSREEKGCSGAVCTTSGWPRALPSVSILLHRLLSSTVPPLPVHLGSPFQ